MQKNYIAQLLLFAIYLSSFSISQEILNENPNYHFHTSKATLEKIMDIIKKKENGVYLRFGDGEINVAKEGHAIEQKPLPGLNLAAEMREAFALNGNNILKALPLNCREMGGYEAGMFQGNHEWQFEQCSDFLAKAKSLWNAELSDVYSQVALHYVSIYEQDFCIEFLKFLRNSNTTTFIGNRNVPDHIIKLLFGDSCTHIKTPARDAYTTLDAIERDTLQVINQTTDYQVIVVMVGPAGLALQKRLWQQCDNLFIFNFGSFMDLLCGWKTREWISLVNFDRNSFMHRLQS